MPILGRIAAGTPIFAAENHQGTLHVDARRYRGEALFALRVQGESMIGAGILDGDLVIVRAQATADPGDIVVALIGDDATVKRFRPKKDHVSLEPENPKMKPIRVPADELLIQGKVIGVQRVMAG
jgi:repressor LexA